MKTKLLIILSVVLLSSCFTNDHIDTYARPETRELSPLGQFAAILETPLSILALAAMVWAIQAAPLVKVVLEAKKEKP